MNDFDDAVAILVDVCKSTNRRIEGVCEKKVKCRNGLGVWPLVVVLMGIRCGWERRKIVLLGTMINLLSYVHLHIDKVVDKHYDRLRKYNSIGLFGVFPKSVDSDQDYQNLSLLHATLTIYAWVDIVRELSISFQDKVVFDKYVDKTIKYMAEIDAGMVGETLNYVKLEKNRWKRIHFQTGRDYNLELSEAVSLFCFSHKEEQVWKEIRERYAEAFEIQDDLDDLVEDKTLGLVNNCKGRLVSKLINKRDWGLEKMNELFHKVGWDELGQLISEMVINYKTGESKMVKVIRLAENRALGFVPKGIDIH